MINLEKIQKSEQRNMIASFWIMLRTIEAQVNNEGVKDPIMKNWVEAWYDQWNRVTGDDKAPVWKEKS